MRPKLVNKRPKSVTDIYDDDDGDDVSLKHRPPGQQLEFKLQGQIRFNLGVSGALYALEASNVEKYLVVRAELEAG
jgi:hypothetical protein